MTTKPRMSRYQELMLKAQADTTTNGLHRELQAWRNRALIAESRLAILEAHNNSQGAN